MTKNWDGLENVLRAKAFEGEVRLARESMAKFLSVGLDSLVVLMETPEVRLEDGDLGSDTTPMMEFIEKELGCELSPETRRMMLEHLVLMMAAHGGMSLCIAWTWAHVIEHASTGKEEVRH